MEEIEDQAMRLVHHLKQWKLYGDDIFAILRKSLNTFHDLLNSIAFTIEQERDE